MFSRRRAHCPLDHIELVQLHERDVDSQGKHLVLFMGISQAGKSTIINALRGMEFRPQGHVLSPVNPDCESAEMANEMTSGMSTTKFPRVWSSGDPSDDFVYLDTRGFFDVRRDEPADLASRILIEMAVRTAASV
jgi:energy-coupling factor transporter ATP-binding protein EcfA2